MIPASEGEKKPPPPLVGFIQQNFLGHEIRFLGRFDKMIPPFRHFQFRFCNPPLFYIEY